MKRYIDLVTKCGVSTYSICKIEKESNELFFIKKKLDIKRLVKFEEINIDVFKDMEEGGKKLRGKANVVVNSSMSDEEIISKINEAVYASQFVKNAYYELPNKEISDVVVADSTLFGKSLAEIASSLAEAAYSVDNDKDAFINSLEIFVSETKKRIVNSNGTDVASVDRAITGEFVAQCKAPQDVETYMDFDYDELALEDLKTLVKETLETTKNRAVAKKTPATGKYDVILTGKYVAEVMNYYVSRAYAKMIYAGYSDFKVGDEVQGGDVKGAKLNMNLVPTTPFTREGIKLVERPLYEDGVLKNIFGDMRFTYYLGVEQIGDYGKVSVPAGDTSLADMKKKPCLHVVNFSDFQMDEMDGHFAGEIRLAYLYDENGNVEFVTGGSVNGSIYDTQGELSFTNETQNLGSFVGPRGILLKNVSVAGE